MWRFTVICCKKYIGFLSCKGFYDPEPYSEQIQEGLDVFHDQLPRALINVVVMFDITPLPDMTTGLDCDVLQA